MIPGELVFVLCDMVGKEQKQIEDHHVVEVHSGGHASARVDGVLRHQSSEHGRCKQSAIAVVISYSAPLLHSLIPDLSVIHRCSDCRNRAIGKVRC